MAAHDAASVCVSVVVAAYDADRHLRECLASVLAQSHANVQLVCVDDGSCDDTPRLLDDAAHSDERVTVIHQGNAGVSAARNRGLASATGDVVLFVDADDQLLPGALARIAQDYVRVGADCAVYGMVVEPRGATPLTLSHRLTPRDRIYEGFTPKLIFGENTHPYAFRVAFRRTFLQEWNIAFCEGLSLGEDEALLLSAYRLSARTLLSSARIYQYRMDPLSASHQHNESDSVLPAKLEKHLDLVENVLCDWRRRGLDDSCDRHILVWALDLLMLDISRLAPHAQRTCYERLTRILGAYFTSGLPHMPLWVRLCTADIERAIREDVSTRVPVVRKAHLVAFYVRSRGLLPVAERALHALRGRGAY